MKNIILRGLPCVNKHVLTFFRVGYYYPALDMRCRLQVYYLT